MLITSCRLVELDGHDRDRYASIQNFTKYSFRITREHFYWTLTYNFCTLVVNKAKRRYDHMVRTSTFERVFSVAHICCTVPFSPSRHARINDPRLHHRYSLRHVSRPVLEARAV